MRIRSFGVLAIVTALVVPIGAGTAGAASPPRVDVGDASVAEGNSGAFTYVTRRAAKVPVTLSDPQPADVTVRYTIVGIDATAGVDFVARSGKLTFRAGARGRRAVSKFVRVPVIPDVLVESDEQVRVEISEVTGSGVVAGRSTGTVTIDDDDPSSGVEVSVGDATVVEGDGGARALQFAVSLSQRSPTGIAVYWQVESVSATCASVRRGAPTEPDQDCGVPRGGIGRLLFKQAPAPPRTGIPGPTAAEKLLTVPVFADTAVEGDEQLVVRLLLVQGAVVRDDTGVGTVIDDD